MAEKEISVKPDLACEKDVGGLQSGSGSLVCFHYQYIITMMNNMMSVYSMHILVI